jgi:hypothetical protein
MDAINQLNEALSQIENVMKFAHDYKLGYVTAIPKLINDFTINIKLRVHEKLEADQDSKTGMAMVLSDY